MKYTPTNPAINRKRVRFLSHPTFLFVSDPKRRKLQEKIIIPYIPEQS
jgi:hypothetical protein